MKGYGLVLFGMLILIGTIFFLVFQNLGTSDQLLSLINISRQDNSQLKLQMTNLQTSVDSLNKQIGTFEKEMEEKNKEIKCLTNYAIYFAKAGYSGKIYANRKIIVGFTEGMTDAQSRGILNSYNLSVISYNNVTNSFAVRVPDGKEIEWACRLSADGNLKYSQPDFTG